MAVRGAEINYTRIAAPRPHLNGFRRKSPPESCVQGACFLRWNTAVSTGNVFNREYPCHRPFLEVKIKAGNVFHLG